MGDIAVAFKDIKSPHRDDSIEKAYLHIEQSLDRIMFGFRIVKSSEPIKPQIDTSYLIVNLKNKVGS